MSDYSMAVENAVLRHAIDRVRALHTCVTHDARFESGATFPICSHCLSGAGGFVDWPCPTIKAMDGAE